MKAAVLSHDVQLFSLGATRIWFVQKYVGQPKEFLQLALTLVLLCYAAVVLWSRRIIVRERSKRSILPIAGQHIFRMRLNEGSS